MAGTTSEWDYLALLLFELLFLAGGILIVKGRKHSLARTFWGDRPENKTMRWVALQLLLGLGVGCAFIFIKEGILVLMKEVVTATFGVQIFQEAWEGAIDFTPLTFSPVGITLAIAGQYCLVGFCEEFFFRGVLFRDLFPRREKLGAVLSASAFMLYHVFPGVVPWVTFAVNWVYYLSLGLLFALLTWSRRYNLIAPIVTHGTFNTILFIISYLL
ncbi:MAG: hypothetical protein RBG13Loki_3278 [Promethearchaeota archaeon CR_4]|nr:MAG: hypothetical protein RBG13Loki_3278 [Candidatus Lokiarchaeota archaeon CR_4]